MLRCRLPGTKLALLPPGLARLFCVLIILAAMHSIQAQTWSGLGGNVNWNTGGNWQGGTAPGAGASLIFAGTTNTGTSGTPLNQNIGAPLTLNSIAFNSGAGTFYLGGGAVRFEAGGSNTITQSSANAQFITNAINAPTNNSLATLTLTGTGTGIVTLSGVIAAGSGSKDYAITKTGTSTFSLTGINTYAGGTTINGGTLAINNSASLGATSGGLTINAGTLEVSTGFTTTRLTTLGNTASTLQIDPSQTYTVNGIISGTGMLNKTGTGTLTLGATNTYSGGTTILAGTLQLGASERLLNTASVTVNGGTFDLQTFSETVAGVTLSSGSIIGSGTLTGSAYAFDAGTVSAPLGGVAALTKSTTGTLTLSGTNTYSGGTTINGGTVVINSSANLGANTGGLTLNAGTLEIATGFTSTRALALGNAASTIQVDSGQTFIVNTAAITGTGVLNKTGAGTIVLGAANTYSGGTVVSAGTLQISASERIANTSDLTVSGGTFDVQTFSETVGTVTLSSGSITGTGTGTVTGSSFAVQSGNATAILAGSGATLTKTTGGTVTLSGANTFTGATTVSGGTLTLSTGSGNAALGSTSGITVNSGGTLLLGASNQINNTATVTLAGGTLAKGNFSEGLSNAPGMGALTLTASGSKLDFGTGTVGVLTFASLTPGSFTLTIDNWTGTAAAQGGAGTDRLIFNSDQSANLNNFYFTGYAPGAMEFSLPGGYYEVVPVVVPEPSTWIGAALTVALLASSAVRRRRKRQR